MALPPITVCRPTRCSSSASHAASSASSDRVSCSALLQLLPVREMTHPAFAVLDRVERYAGPTAFDAPWEPAEMHSGPTTDSFALTSKARKSSVDEADQQVRWRREGRGEPLVHRAISCCTQRNPGGHHHGLSILRLCTRPCNLSSGWRPYRPNPPPPGDAELYASQPGALRRQAPAWDRVRQQQPVVRHRCQVGPPGGQKD